MKYFIFILLIFNYTALWAMINGTYAEVRQFPSSVYIQEGLCSAVAIRPDVLLTAGHCVNRSLSAPALKQNQTISILSYSVPENSQSRKFETFEVTIKEAQSHGSWLTALSENHGDDRAASQADGTYDLAYIILDQALPLPSAALATKSLTYADYSDESFIVTGFGCEEVNAPPSENLKFAAARIMSATVNQWSLSMQSFKICGGDSGGANYSRSGTLLGITSGLRGSFIGISTRLDQPEILAWLNEILNKPRALKEASEKQQECRDNCEFVPTFLRSKFLEGM